MFLPVRGKPAVEGRLLDVELPGQMSPGLGRSAYQRVNSFVKFHD
jgi:hypothetical protein